jgi:hypothetical protein
MISPRLRTCFAVVGGCVRWCDHSLNRHASSRIAMIPTEDCVLGTPSAWAISVCYEIKSQSLFQRPTSRKLIRLRKTTGLLSCRLGSGATHIDE